MKTAIAFQIGEICGGVKILQIEPGITLTGNRYFVEYMCCGAKGWIGHKPMTARKKGYRVMCRSCAGRAVQKHAVKPKKPKQVYIENWGMTLGSFNRS